MPHVVWRPKARQDARNILDYISDRNASAALRLADLFEQAAEKLTDHPYMHRPGRVADTREAIVTPNYLLIYRVTEDRIEILAVKHTRQQYP
ncbi:type II toxin-antitoxin system RelE/ParE family toxin [Sphingobium sp. CCH11-B1]|jgi:addiction module RelE/StbE family toxin|uniref:type II toxin-antitoxin system RelE/ParE family toxin n=1 Tax=Sphingobium sp. CCH11-B1 TaxID=1768781 RepID=UPI00082E038A|nr:type II toxin-antitoxin system mRNA interferase toxin, RelE/StbE family [Sphingobium sp. CCH11-B1]MEA3388585.1 type II toxin-antitoxin system mRNA interferase toxin, RelE/StbE family [Pseudomonadota bacterium]